MVAAVAVRVLARHAVAVPAAVHVPKNPQAVAEHRRVVRLDAIAPLLRALEHVEGDPVHDVITRPERRHRLG